METQMDEGYPSAKEKLESAVSQCGESACEIVFTSFEAFSLATISEQMDGMFPETRVGRGVRAKMILAADAKVPMQFGESEAKKLLNQVDHFLELTEDEK